MINLEFAAMNRNPSCIVGQNLLTRFNNLIPRKKGQVVLQIDDSKAETLIGNIQDDHLDEELILKTFT